MKEFSKVFDVERIVRKFCVGKVEIDPEGHYNRIADEIWEDVDDNIEHYVSRTVDEEDEPRPVQSVADFEHPAPTNPNITLAPSPETAVDVTTNGEPEDHQLVESSECEKCKSLKYKMKGNLLICVGCGTEYETE